MTATHRRDLVRELLLRDIRLRYRRSILGLLWSQLAPLSLVVVLSIVFSRVVRLGIPDYPVFVFVGLSAWRWFQAGVVTATSSVTDNRDVVRLPGFPLRLLPPVAISSELANYVLSLPVLLGAIAWATGRVPITVVALPVLVFIQFLLCLGPSYLLSVSHVTMRDTAQILGVVLLLLFYATPILYHEEFLLDSGFRLLYVLNPLAHVIEAQRDVLLYGRWPDVGALGLVSLFAFTMLALGVRVFRSAEAWMPDEV